MPETEPMMRREASSPYGEWNDTAHGDLMSYRYLASRPHMIDRDHAEGFMRLRGDLRTPSGLLVAPLTIAMLDVAGINIDRINVLALTQFEVTVVDDAEDVAEVYLTGLVAKEGRTQVFTESLILDAADRSRVIGFGLASWAVIVPTAQGFVYPEPGAGIPDTPEAPPLWEAYTGRKRADGYFEIPSLSPKVGTQRLHHGPISVILEAAALEAATASKPGCTAAVRHVTTSILNPGRIGPFVARSSLIAQHGDDLVCRSELRDVGHEDRVVARSFHRVLLRAPKP